MSRQNRPQMARDDVRGGRFQHPLPSAASPGSRPPHGPRADTDDDASATPVDVTAVPPPEPVAVGAPAPPAPAPPRFVALVLIYAQPDVYAVGDEIPVSVAQDGLTEGEHWRRG